MQAFAQLVYFDLPIPVWHLVLYVGCISFLMIQRRFKLAIVTSYVLVLYWLHYIFRANLVSIMDGDNVARTIYYLFGFALVLLSIYAFFFLEDEATEFELEKRKRDIAGLRTKAKDAKNKASDLKAQFKKDQITESAASKKLEADLDAKIGELEYRLKEGEGVLEKRDAEIAELTSKTHEAEKNASGLMAQLENDQNRESVARKKQEKEFSTRVDKLESQLKNSVSLLEKRDAEITELQAKADEAADNASALKAQLEKEQTQESASKKNLKEVFNTKIARLEQQLTEGESLLEKRDAEIAELTSKTHEAEKNASALKAQLEKEQTQEIPTRNNLEEELKAKNDELEHRLMEGQSLLLKRDAEIAELQTKADEFKENTSAIKTQLENDQNRESVTTKKLEEKFSTRIDNLESQLEKGVSLLKKRDAEITELQAKTDEAAETASALKAQLEKEQTQESASKRNLKEDFNTRIARLEQQLEEGESLLKKRDAEIVELTTKTHEADKHASALKAQLEKDQTQESASKIKLEDKFNAKIAKLEQQLTDGESLLIKRDAEITELRAKAPVPDKKAAPLKPLLAVNRQGAQTKSPDDKSAVEDDVRKKLHQFQYAIKYLEDQVKEKDRLLGIMVKKGAQTQGANNNTTVEEDAKKKIQELEQGIKYLQGQVKEKDGLLSLMAKRNRELADLKSKAEESLEASKTEGNEAQTDNGRK